MDEFIFNKFLCIGLHYPCFFLNKRIDYYFREAENSFG